MQAPRSHEKIREVNARYHDAAASEYDTKWAVDFGPAGRSQVLGKVRKLLHPLPAGGFPRALEIGAGTGYFGLNLLGAGVIGELTCTDISAGMLRMLADNATRIGLTQVRTVQSVGESLPFADASFDLVLGHAVLHHLPDLDAALAEFRRVLTPGGRILFAGEPSRTGDQLARVPKRAATCLAPLWRRALGAAPAHNHVGHASPHPDRALESQVDVHAFVPADLERLVQDAGFTDVTIRGEELVANWFGWFNRGLEATAVPDDVPIWWRRYAFHGYLLLQHLDAALLEPILPTPLFYNLLLTARAPEAGVHDE